MIIHLIIIALILILGFHFSRKKDSESDYIRKKYIRIVCAILLLQSGLRNVAVGSDTYAYFLSFNDSMRNSWHEVYERIIDFYSYNIGKDPGYSVFEKLVSSTFPDYQFLLMVIAIIFFTALGNFIYQNTTRLIDAMLAFVIYSVLFYSFFSITGHRQTIATAAALYGFELIKRKKLILFLIIILIASTIHKSVLLFIPFYFIAQISKPKFFFRIVLILFPFIMVFRESLSTYLKALGGYEEYGINAAAGTSTFTTLFLLISIAALLRSKIILKNNIKAQQYYNAFAVALLFIPLTWVNPSAMRVVQYFSIFMLLFIPEIIYSFQVVSPRVKKHLTVFTVIILIVLFLKANGNAAPYGFFWEEMRLGENYF
ncbi:EpsG family protein [Flavobacterium sp. F-328]|uniref:EpsG family protein n=1 Tax=Flavobacterium erciyesense TaxID=2825842 RepID=A0ABS5D6G6_9FLAO|nr:EpsG family protein [Flavobacterium erciyesense]MBQ0909632.1 EpsG family protein [Flavobacterium erciyesense]